MATYDRLKAGDWRGQRARYKQVKYDGHRFTVTMSDGGRIVGYEREVRPDLEMTVRHPEIVELAWWKKLLALPLGSSICGELYVPGGNAGDATHAIADCSPELAFMPFAVPFWSGMDWRHADLPTARARVVGMGLPFAEFFPLARGVTREELCDDAIERRIEGWVLKNFNYDDWWKVKPIKTLDAVVAGFTSGKGQYVGQIGALIVSAWVSGEYVELANISGMDDETRRRIDDPLDFGRVCEVEYQYLGNRGRLVHPRFVRWRSDKPASQCTYDREEI